MQSLLVSIFGCGNTIDPKIKDEFHAITNAYDNFHIKFKRAPKDLAELKTDLTELSEPAYKRVEAGAFVVIWNVDVDANQPADDYILVYEKDVPTKGGLVA